MQLLFQCEKETQKKPIDEQWDLHALPCISHRFSMNMIQSLLPMNAQRKRQHFLLSL